MHARRPAERLADHLSTTEVSGALGVSVTTVRCWMDHGFLPAHRTAGGHRRLLLPDVLCVVREGKFPRLDLGRLHLPAAGPGAEALSTVLAALKARGGVKVRSLTHGAYRAGVAMGDIADEVGVKLSVCRRIPTGCGGQHTRGDGARGYGTCGEGPDGARQGPNLRRRERVVVSGRRER